MVSRQGIFLDLVLVYYGLWANAALYLFLYDYGIEMMFTFYLFKKWNRTKQNDRDRLIEMSGAHKA